MSWATLTMLTASIPVHDSGEESSKSHDRGNKTMSLWDIGRRITEGKGV